jgi:hypothetical protein
MDHVGILKRAYRIAVKYPILWVFGFFAASGTTVGNFPTSWNFNYNRRIPEGRREEFLRRFSQTLGNLHLHEYIPLILGVAGLLLLLFLIWLVLHYVAETGLYRMISEMEESGERPSWTRGWHLGWDRRAWSLFLIDLIVSLTIVLMILLVVIAGFGIAMGIGEHMSVGMVFLLVIFVLVAILVVMVIAIVLSLLSVLGKIHSAVTGSGALDSIGWAWGTLTERWKDIGIMWLLMLGVGILLGIILLFALVLLGLLTGLVAVLPAWIVWKGTQSLALALATGGILGLISLVIPLMVLQAAIRTFNATVWTLVHREVASEPGEAIESAPA